MLSQQELDYLGTQRLARLATVDDNGSPRPMRSASPSTPIGACSSPTPAGARRGRGTRP